MDYFDVKDKQPILYCISEGTLSGRCHTPTGSHVVPVIKDIHVTEDYVTVGVFLLAISSLTYSHLYHVDSKFYASRL